MIDSGYNFLSHQEVSYFEKVFEESKPEKDPNIRFGEFKEISMNYKKFNRAITAETLERLRRNKDRQNNMNDNEILVSRHDFFEYLDEIYAEHNKRSNERDPELINLFEMLANGNTTISKKNITDIIIQFELPIKSDDFFSPIGKKENLSFEDFCLLFKNSSKQDDIFLKSFSGGFMNTETEGSAFPVSVNKFKKA